MCHFCIWRVHSEVPSNRWLHLFTHSWSFLTTCNLVRRPSVLETWGERRLMRCLWAVRAVWRRWLVAMLLTQNLAYNFKKENGGLGGVTDEACCLVDGIQHYTRVGKTRITSNNVHSYVCFYHIQPLCSKGIHPWNRSSCLAYYVKTKWLASLSVWNRLQALSCFLFCVKSCISYFHAVCRCNTSSVKFTHQSAFDAAPE